MSYNRYGGEYDIEYSDEEFISEVQTKPKIKIDEEETEDEFIEAGSFVCCWH